MSKENVGQGIGLAAIFLGVGLSIIGLVSVIGDLANPPPAVPETPEAMLRAQPPAAIPLAPIASPAAAAAPVISPQEKAEGELRNLLLGWRDAWSKQDSAAYLTYYLPDYQGNSASPEQWQASRKRVLEQAKFIDIELGEPVIQFEADDRATLSFAMKYLSNRLEDSGTKQLRVRYQAGQWLIEQESFVAN